MKFTKMHGAGNDFVILDNRNSEIDEARYSLLAETLCRRKLSLGADGLIIILPPQKDGDYAMRFYNSDGSLGEMCGNGARCVARYGHDHGLAGDVQRIETTAGLVIGERIEETLYRVRLNDPSRIVSDVAVQWKESVLHCGYAELGDPGIPHAVLRMNEWETMEESALRELGAFLRHHPSFPHGANVTFWRPLGRNHVKAVTYERGVEDFTLACGTGAGSTASILRITGVAEDAPIQLDFPGGTLQVSLTLENDTVSDIYLTGPAVTVAEGDVLV